MTKDIDIVNAKIESLKIEISEYKAYIEICAITIIFILTAFFGTQNGIDQIKTGTSISRIIVITSLILMGAIIYLF